MAVTETTTHAVPIPVCPFEIFMNPPGVYCISLEILKRTEDIPLPEWVRAYRRIITCLNNHGFHKKRGTNIYSSFPNITSAFFAWNTIMSMAFCVGSVNPELVPKMIDQLCTRRDFEVIILDELENQNHYNIAGNTDRRPNSF